MSPTPKTTPLAAVAAGTIPFLLPNIPKPQGLQELLAYFKAAKKELGKVIVGLENEVEVALACAFIGGHVLLQGDPGLAKTLLAKSIAKVLGLDFKRQQCTADLMPADFTGTLFRPEGSHEFVLTKGPLFSDVLLVDEINRCPPKSQSALLEAMEEKQVTICGNTHALSPTFWLIATQNETGSLGTYPLPFPQIDRFCAKIELPHPSRDEMIRIIDLTTNGTKDHLQTIFPKEEAATLMQGIDQSIRSITMDPCLKGSLVDLVNLLDPCFETCLASVEDVVEIGPSVRGIQSIVLLAKAFAALSGRSSIDKADLIRAAYPTLVHRFTACPFQSDNESFDPKALIEEALTEVFGGA
jgi:MoxR-like ATPase